VDSHVAHHLFVHAVDGFIRATGKTAVVVTNQLQFLPMADHILMLQNGAVVERGSFEHLKVHGKQFGLLVAEFGVIDTQGPASGVRRNKSAHALAENTDDVSPTALLLADAEEAIVRSEDSEDEIDLNEALSYADKAKKAKDSGEKNKLLAEPPKSPISKKSRRTGSKDSTGSSKRSDSKIAADPAINTVGGDGDLGALMSAEQRETGNITTALYWYYMKGGSILMLSFVLITCLLGNIARIVATLFLSNWTTDHDLLVHSRGFYVGMFALFSGLEIFFVGLHLIGFILFAIRASGALHSHLLGSILRATSAFFDATPMGRLMSRFAKDISLIDLVLPLQFDQYINMIFTLLSVITLVMVGTYWIIFIAVPVVIGYFLLTNYYRKTSIEIQRLESLSRAPVFSHLNETIEGASIIRAYNMVKAFKVANYNKVDLNTVDFYALRYCNMWLGLRLDWMGTLLLAGTWFGIIISRNLGTANESSAGVALSAAVGLTFLLSNLSMNATETETRMNAVERIKQYTVVPQEADEIVVGNRTTKLWPAEGKIQMNNVVVSYNKREQILKSMTCHIRPREKVGVVGRTGAGKSTLMAALLRLVEPSAGQIIIDGIDILKIGLYDLRSKLSIIPQTPTMFIGTVRYNLDPFDEHSDPELWQALEMVQLKSFISAQPGKLMAPVEENGGNFSVGQRQLLAMARALVRNSNILLLDEATAAVDTETDAMIQRMIRTIFKDKTVITIAHRLNTIMDSDRVLVLDKGEIKEFDSPKVLLQSSDGIFTGMVEATGPSSAEHLRKIANGELSVVENIIQQDPKQKKRRDSQEDVAAVLDKLVAIAPRRTSLSDSDSPPARYMASPSTSPSDFPAMSPGVSSPIQMSTSIRRDPESPSSPSSIIATSDDDEDETIL
jgi:ATP-binding cassette, subfamily C (CFTR/MRP), member 1